MFPYFDILKLQNTPNIQLLEFDWSIGRQILASNKYVGWGIFENVFLEIFVQWKKLRLMYSY